MTLEAANSILVVGAHPDDAELGCGAAIAEWVSQGHYVAVAIAAMGGANAPERQREQEAACKILGADVHGFGLPDGGVEERALFRLVEKFMESFPWGTVVSHQPNDTHADHRAVSAAVSAACRRGPSLLWMESPTAVGFTANHYVPVSEESVAKALSAIEEHHSQGLPAEAYGGRLLYRGRQVGVRYAEGLASAKYIGRGDG